MELDTNADISDKSTILIKQTSRENLVIESTVAPVIIEELDDDAVKSMDMNEFVEAKALKLEDDTIIHASSHKDIILSQDQDTAASLTADEEDQLTKQFLNGELTFSEYSSRMDDDRDLDDESCYRYYSLSLFLSEE